MTSRENYARYLQNKYEEYMKDFASKTNRTIEEVIIKYVGMDNTKEAMYNTDIILGFLADYYDYYTHVYNQALENDYITDELKQRISKLDEEYEIFEKLIIASSFQFSKELSDGVISSLKTDEIAKGIKGTITTRITSKELLELSKWIRNAYYKFVDKYRNKQFTVVIPSHKEITFSIEDGNLPHLLGIPNDRRISSFRKMQILSELVNKELTDTEVDNIFSLIKDNFSFDKIKYKIFLFQNFRLLDSSVPLRIHYDVIPNKNQVNDCNTYIITKSRDKLYKKSCLGLYCTKLNDKKRTGIVKSIIAKDKEDFDGKKTDISMITSIFVNPVNNPNQKELIGIFSREEQYNLIYDLLATNPQEGHIMYMSLLPYFKRLETNLLKLQNARENLADIKENIKEKSR